MDTKQMKTFLTICQYKNFTHAADHLGYAQSTVSSQIQAIEKEYDVRLFEKIGRNIQLTAEGMTMMYYIKQITSLEQQMQQDMSNIHLGKKIIRIGVAESLCYNYIPTVCHHFAKLFPNVELKIVFGDSRSLPTLLQDNTIDLGLSLSHLIQQKNVLILHKERAGLALLVNPQHPLRAADTIVAKDLEPYPFLLTAKGCSYRAELERVLNRYNIEPNIELETDSKEILKRFTMNSMGITFLPETTVMEELNTKKLYKLNWSEDFDIWYQILVHKEKKISTVIEALIECLTSTSLSASVKSLTHISDLET